MKKFIIFLIILALFGVGAYYFLMQLIGDGDQVRCGDGFRFDPSKNTCVEVVVPDEQKELDFSSLEIKVPDSNTVVNLEENSQGMYFGTYGNSPTSSFMNSVLIDPKKQTEISDVLVLIPITVDSGGTGQFTYAGVFNKTTNTHIDSFFIGDRIPVGDIDVVGDIVKINYKTRLLTQSFAENPTVLAQLVLEMRDASIVKIMRLQNSDYQEVEIREPAVGSPVSGKFVIKGSVPGFWYFEAITGYKILDKNNIPLTEGTITALSDWMTTQRVPFQLELDTDDIDYVGQAVFVIESENVQGDEEGELKVKRLEYPITIR